ncbi:MAG TPA: transglycosylase domain-containing protein [Magnetospirillum sp.]|nr:transglycosylase domain-containing protein [Magnetospirillum sp.]
MKKLLLGFAIALAVLVAGAEIVVGGVVLWATQDAQNILAAAELGKPLCTDEQTGAELASGVPPHLRSAFVAAEEPRFFERSGLRVTASPLWWDMAAGRLFRSRVFAAGIVRCCLRDWRGGHFQWMVKTWALTYLVDRIAPKDLILDSYMHVVSLEPGVRGIDAASRAYFGKSPAALTVAEAAYLAGLAKSPGRYAADDRLGVERRNAVLASMRDVGAITAAQYEAAVAQPLGRARQPAGR